MKSSVLNRLDKVLALVDSDQEGEAVSAVRMARQLLSNDGLSFGDLARAAQQRPEAQPVMSHVPGQETQLEGEVRHLRQRIDDLRLQIQEQDTQVRYWRQRASEFETKLADTQDEAGRWRQLARDTVEKLWDLGLAVQQYGEIMSGERDKKAG